MRDTKFRGKRIDNGKWVYGYYVYCRHHAYILPIYNEDDPDPCFDERWIQEGADDEGWIEVIPETVGQFTGLESKSGVEIYKGNTVKSPDGLRKYLVMWNEKQGCYYLKGIGKAWTMHQHIAWKEFEVVGENPELMEKPK